MPDDKEILNEEVPKGAKRVKVLANKKERTVRAEYEVEEEKKEAEKKEEVKEESKPKKEEKEDLFWFVE